MEIIGNRWKKLLQHFWLEIMIIIKIESHPCYPTNFQYFQFEKIIRLVSQLKSCKMTRRAWILINLRGCQAVPKKVISKVNFFLSLAILILPECFKILCQNNSFDYIFQGGIQKFDIVGPTMWVLFGIKIFTQHSKFFPTVLKVN